MKTLKQIVKDSVEGTSEQDFQVYSTLGGKVKAQYNPKTSVVDMDHEKTYVVCQEIEPSYPESFLLEFRFCKLTKGYRGADIEPD